MSVNRRVRLGILGALAAVVVAGVGVGLQQASAATVNTNAWYVFVNRHSGKAMDVFEWSTADGARIAQWARLDGFNQQWQFVDAGSGYYKIRSRHSGKLLELPNATDGTDLVQTTDRGDNRQQFRLLDSDSGYVRFVNRHSNKALDLWGWSTADGGRIVGLQRPQRGQPAVADGPGRHRRPAAHHRAAAHKRVRQRHRRGRGDAERQHLDRAQRRHDPLHRRRHARGHAGRGEQPDRGPHQQAAGRGPRFGQRQRGVPAVAAAYTILEVCGTINVTGSGSGDMAPVYSRGTTDIEVRNLNLTGTPVYGIFMRNVNNLILGRIDMRVSSGLGVRIDNHGGDRAVKVRNIRIDNVYVPGTSSHAVETYGVDGITIGTVTARNIGESGLLLQRHHQRHGRHGRRRERRHRHRLRRVPDGQPQRTGRRRATRPTSGSARSSPAAAAAASSASRRAAARSSTGSTSPTPATTRS